MAIGAAIAIGAAVLPAVIELIRSASASSNAEERGAFLLQAQQNLEADVASRVASGIPEETARQSAAEELQRGLMGLAGDEDAAESRRMPDDIRESLLKSAMQSSGSAMGMNPEALPPTGEKDFNWGGVLLQTALAGMPAVGVMRGGGAAARLAMRTAGGGKAGVFGKALAGAKSLYGSGFRGGKKQLIRTMQNSDPYTWLPK